MPQSNSLQELIRMSQYNKQDPQLARATAERGVDLQAGRPISSGGTSLMDSDVPHGMAPESPFGKNLESTMLIIQEYRQSGNPELMAQADELEKMVMEASGQLDQLNQPSTIQSLMGG